MNFFDYLYSINTTKVNLTEVDSQNEKEYVPFMINRSLSYFYDTIFYCNEMNRYASIPKEWQYDFYLTAIPKKKRFSKWAKREKNSADVELIMKHYNYSSVRALEALTLLTPEALKNLRAHYSSGGR